MKKKNYINKTFANINAFFLKNSKLSKLKGLMYHVDKVLRLSIRKGEYRECNKKKVAVIFNLALGDGVIMCSVLEKIRELYPNDAYELTLICQQGLQTIYEQLGIFDKIVPLNFTKATVNIRERYKLLKKLRSEYYDILLDPVGANDCSTNVLMSKNILAKQKVGCLLETHEVVCSNKILNNTYNELRKIKSRTLIEQFFEYFYDEYQISYYKFNSVKLKTEIPKEYYIIFPSASTDLKKWPMERMAEIAKSVYKKTKLPLLLCGTETDRKSYEELLSLIGNIPYQDIIGKTSLLEFITVIKRAKFVITNDTSTYHIAVTQEVPVTIIAGSYTYDQYVSYDFKGNDKYRKPYIVAKKMSCFNCYNKCNKIKHDDKIWPCLGEISVEHAWKTIEKMIDKEVK